MNPIVLSVLLLACTAANAGELDHAQAQYQQTCIACHGADTRGTIPGVPDFTAKGGRLTQADDVLANHILEGFQSPGSSMAMPAKGGNPTLTEADAKALVRYLHALAGK